MNIGNQGYLVFKIYHLVDTQFITIVLYLKGNLQKH